ncbi:MAG: 3-deoxy-8-phosphooctulonate synthase [Cyclobacteriaceae bacterium]|nr:3-deoxy-8-phosphooctulonate synthase [Cyclobacteriaceae bacterium]
MSEVKISGSISVGKGKMVLFSGPCVIESRDICLEVASSLKNICSELDIQYIFKASFDKANRTSLGSFRGIGTREGLKVLQEVKERVEVPVITDVHEIEQVDTLAETVDVLQIPAFLCRQTSLLVKAGKSGKAVNIKKGQFMAPEDMKFAVEKVKSTGNENVLLTERGSSFGYHDLIVDFRALPVMRNYCPVIFDVTHSVQQPGGSNGKSGGQREYAPYLARAAAAVGVDGFFIETHPDPSKALSDGPNMIPLEEMKDFLQMLKKYWEL